MPARKMKFSVKHAKDSEFEGGGLRPVFEYRDLGIRKATGGAYGAHVIRARRRLGHPMGVHHHTLDFQMVYILKGWAKFHYAGEGEVTVRKGDCIHQPPGIHHDLLDYSRDLEMLEITTPAAFATRTVAPKKKSGGKTRAG
jgi:mannose-6-phosphate isomerase-like protein (cupin superfamily)